MKSRPALRDHIAALLRAEPMDPIVKAFQLSVQEEGRRLVLTTLGWNGFNEVNTEVWARTFKDMASSVRAAIWLSTDHDCGAACKIDPLSGVIGV